MPGLSRKYASGSCSAVAEELVAALERDAVALRLGEQARDLADRAARLRLLLLVDGDVGVLGRERSAAHSSARSTLLVRLAQLLRRGTPSRSRRWRAAPPRWPRVGLGVRGGEERRQRRARRREADLDQIGAAHVAAPSASACSDRAARVGTSAVLDGSSPSDSRAGRRRSRAGGAGASRPPPTAPSPAAPAPGCRKASFVASWCCGSRARRGRGS